MRIIVAGDTHGSERSVRGHIDMANTYGSDRVLVLGDFGLWPGYEGVKFLDDINSYARQNNVDIYALPGNHEDYNQWNNYLNGPFTKSKSGFTYIRDHVLISPKVHQWSWANKRFFIAGGAVSIDKQWRKTDVSWWADEEFQDKHLDSVLKYAGPKTDYFMTHDCSDKTPWRSRLKPDLESTMNRQRIDKALRHLQPRFHFHGHMHERYEWMNRTGDDFWTNTYGLECNMDRDSCGLLDTDSDTFIFATDLTSAHVIAKPEPVLFDDNF